ncbi:MAG: hypothetical protein KJ886_05775 [Candidatus Thermoplasmatota archaeon]|nr:hypothetical protein [Candidatus Thermoplasmatota archaeon]MCG2827532.1 hypothetical protein [Thermoplasmatales archaeon]
MSKEEVKGVCLPDVKVISYRLENVVGADPCNPGLPIGELVSLAALGRYARKYEKEKK